jgi:hypothetical protein
LIAAQAALEKSEVEFAAVMVAALLCASFGVWRLTKEV